MSQNGKKKDPIKDAFGPVIPLKKYANNRRIGFEDEFRVLGGNDYTFLPYDFTSPIIGGTSENSLYYKSLRREVGWLTDEFILPTLNFSCLPS